VNYTDKMPGLSWMLSKRLLVITGKGGVGKSAICAALGKVAADHGRKVLLAEVRSMRRLPELFGLDANHDGPMKLGPNLMWINLKPESALEVYALKLLKLRTVYRAVFEQRTVRKFLRVVPSLAEILMLGYVVHMLEQGEADLIVMDAPSTGPGTLMLQAPGVVMETAPPGPLRQGAHWIQSLLGDREKCAVCIAVLAEELPVSEAIELFHTIRDEVSVPMGVCFANRLLVDPGVVPDVDLLNYLSNVKQCSVLKDTWYRYDAKVSLQNSYLDKLEAGVNLPLVKLPEIMDDNESLVDCLAVELDKMMGDRH